ncbi:hypothetical protein C2S52_015975 [Perilla frutescens var. hirtella]|nr:hypothetical protein C2S52_015975 [Perilla frutescens var. hirtella]KAH6815241.1 hypothetical protein C2S51_020061 [Perilla frutescens var. frutescens]
MALRGGDRARSARSGSKQEMSVEEFKKWLMKFDSDKDGRISQSELRAAIRSRGGWFMTTRKSGRGMSEADVDGSGYIDENEIDSLLEFAEGSMGFKFY